MTPMKPSDAHPTLETLIDLTDGRAPLEATLVEHVEVCPHCAERLRLVTDQGQLLRRLAADVRGGPWRGSNCVERVCSRAQRQWRALARLLVLATLRTEPGHGQLLAELPPSLPAHHLRGCLQRLTRRLGQQATARPGPPADPAGLLRWLRRVDGPGPWWQVLSAAALLAQGRRAAAVRQARRAHAALTLFGPLGDDDQGLLNLARDLLVRARRPAASAARQEPSANPSLRDSLAPR